MKRNTRYIRRYTHRRRRMGSGGWFAMIAAAGLVVYLALAMGAGAWVHGLVFGEEATDEITQTENEHVDAETEKNVQPQEITETVAFPAMDYYALSVPLHKEESAQKTALLCRARGGAGFIREEDILLAVYENSAAGGSVAERLSQEQGMEARLVPLTADAVELRLTALPQRIDGIRDVFSAWQQTIQQMDALWQDLDGGVASTEQAVMRLTEKRADLEKACDAAFDDSLLSGRSDALEGFCGVVRETVAQMDALLLEAPENILEVSAGIKYTVIKALTEYQLYVNALKAA